MRSWNPVTGYFDFDLPGLIKVTTRQNSAQPIMANHHGLTTTANRTQTINNNHQRHAGALSPLLSAGSTLCARRAFSGKPSEIVREAV